MMRIMARRVKAATVGVALEITCQAPETAEPGKGAFDNSALE